MMPIRLDVLAGARIKVEFAAAEINRVGMKVRGRRARSNGNDDVPTYTDLRARFHKQRILLVGQ